MEHFRGQATRVANNRGGLKWMLRSIHNTAWRGGGGSGKEQQEEEGEQEVQGSSVAPGLLGSTVRDGAHPEDNHFIRAAHVHIHTHVSSREHISGLDQ